ncbi:MAG: acetyl-CoA carboxylase carboxyl transferase subunit alpha, partial [Thermoanaerobaculia bacterium]
SVISPEGCAAILWKDQEQREVAAEAMRLTASDIFELGLVDGVIPEPLGGAHADVAETCRRVGEKLAEALEELGGLTPDQLVQQRYDRFRALGEFEER